MNNTYACVCLTVISGRLRGAIYCNLTKRIFRPENHKEKITFCTLFPRK
jgi:hypothetical protein